MAQHSQDPVRYFEYIVVGCGGIGSGTVYWLSKRVGKAVLGLERFTLGHERGGSQDHARIIRVDYHDDDYTPLVRDSYTTIQDVERESGLKLIHITGRLMMVNKDDPRSEIVAAYEDAMTKANLNYEIINSTEIQRRFPQFCLESNVVGLYTKDSGLVDAAMTNAAHIQLARRNGATIEENCQVLKMEKDKDGVHVLVHTTKDTFRARHVIVTAGGWTNQVLSSLDIKLPLTVTQEQATFVATPNLKDFTKERFPVWSFLTPKYHFYGFPMHGNTGVKIGMSASGPTIHPDQLPSTPDPKREKTCLEFMNKRMPKAVGPILYTKTCLYDMTPDRKYIIDSLATKGYPQIYVCSGAGHAYKFVGLFGKILSEMVIDGRTKYPIGPFRVDRDALTDKNFEPDFHFKNIPKSKAKL